MFGFKLLLNARQKRVFSVLIRSVALSCTVPCVPFTGIGLHGHLGSPVQETELVTDREEGEEETAETAR